MFTDEISTDRVNYYVFLGAFLSTWRDYQIQKRISIVLYKKLSKLLIVSSNLWKILVSVITFNSSKSQCFKAFIWVNQGKCDYLYCKVFCAYFGITSLGLMGLNYNSKRGRHNSKILLFQSLSNFLRGFFLLWCFSQNELSFLYLPYALLLR